MEKLKNIIKWVGVDGLLHFLACYGLMLAVYPMYSEHCTGAVVASCATVIVAIVKEIYDAIAKGATIHQAIHDFICDGIGMAAGSLTWFIWYLAGL